MKNSTSHQLNLPPAGMVTDHISAKLNYDNSFWIWLIGHIGVEL